MLIDKNGIYKYKGYSVTPSICGEIIFEVYKNNNNIIGRSDIINAVFYFHTKNGGASGVPDKTLQIKKALSDINTLYYKKVRTGFYEFLINENTLFEDFYTPKRRNRKSDSDSINNTISKYDSINLKEGWVYFYYYPTYKDYSILKNEDRFPIKIGKTKSDPKFRVNEQSGTALPEPPFIFLQVKTNDCSNLEKVFHSLLSLLKCKSQNSVGNEWFLSNEENILDLLDKIKNLGIHVEIYRNKKTKK